LSENNSDLINKVTPYKSLEWFSSKFGVALDINSGLFDYNVSRGGSYTYWLIIYSKSDQPGTWMYAINWDKEGSVSQVWVNPTHSWVEQLGNNFFKSLISTNTVKARLMARWNF